MAALRRASLVWVGPDPEGPGLPPAHRAGPHRRGFLLAAAGGWAGRSPSAAAGSSFAPGTSWACSAASGWAQRLWEHRRYEAHTHPPGLRPTPSLPVLSERRQRRQCQRESHRVQTVPRLARPPLPDPHPRPFPLSPGGSLPACPTHLSYAEGSVLAGRWAGREQEAGRC